MLALGSWPWQVAEQVAEQTEIRVPTTITKLSLLANHARALSRANLRWGCYRDRRHRRGAALPLLLLMTDPARLPDPAPAVAQLPRGSGVILRHQDPRARARLARALAPLCRRQGVLLLIAGDPRLAAELRADGVHFPESRGAEARAWRRRRPRWLITTAAHDGPALQRAARAGAQAALLSPVFATASHPGARPLGPVRFTRLVHRSPLPVYALGGVTAESARKLKTSGTVGIAGISGLATGGDVI